MDLILEHKKIFIVIFIGLLVSIPSLAFLIKQRTSFESDAAGVKTYSSAVTDESTSSAQEVPKDSPFDTLLGNQGQKPSPTPASSDDEDLGLSSELTFGPTLNFKLSIEGRPTNNQAAKIFAGLASGDPIDNPSYLLSFSVDIPATGVYQGLSLAGLTINETYTAYIKGPAQLATASAFVVRPNISELNSGFAINMTSGDLNEDNIINNSDYQIELSAYGTTPSSPNWNSNLDLNKDNLVNLLDLSIITKNLGKVGAGNVYVSKVSSGSANINPQQLIKPSSQGNTTSSGKTGPGSTGTGGYWMWVPEF